MDSYQLADKYGMLDRSEVDLLKKCVQELPPKAIIVNIGASVGTSVCAIMEERPKAFIFSIDKKPSPDEYLNLVECGLPADRVIRVLCSSYTIDGWPIKPHLTFVDGNHSDQAVLQDIEKWESLTKKFMLFHDYHHPNLKDNAFDSIIDTQMGDWGKIGEARYLVAFRRSS